MKYFNYLSRADNKRISFLLLLFFIIFMTFSIMKSEIFLSAANLESILLQSSIIGILSLAVALTMLTGGIDLSVNATANLAAISASFILTHMAPQYGSFWAIFVAIICIFFVGFLCGLLNGSLIAIIGCPPILVTLGTMMFFTGIGTIITKGTTVFGIEALSQFGRMGILGIPFPAILFLILGFLLTFMLSKFELGRYIYLYGTSPKVSKFSGIQTQKVLIKTYIISGLLAASAGLASIAISNSANVTFGNSYVLLAVLIAVLGGIAPEGGKGKIMGVIIAVFLLQLLSTGLNIIYQSSGSNFLKEFAWGLSLLLVLAMGRIKTFGGLKIHKG